MTASVKDGDVKGLNVAGELTEVAMDIGSIIEAVSHTLRRACPEAEAEFREILQWLVADESPLWKGGGKIVGGSVRVVSFIKKGKSNYDDA